MRPTPSLACLLCATALWPGARGDWVDRLDDALSWTSADDSVRARLSGTLDLEYYRFQQPPPGLIDADGRDLLNPRLSLFLDAQLGPQVYAFVQARADRGFDPGAYGGRVRLDEYALRWTPGAGGAASLQVGKFATVAGNWVGRHQSWDNPFVTAPLPYENPTGIFDSVATPNTNVLLLWSDVRPGPGGKFIDFGAYRVPIIWGPSYASGAALAGERGALTYALEVKNASLSSRPEDWPAGRTDGWGRPTWTGRLGWKPDASWNLGVSASSGTYLQAAAAPTLAPGTGLADYRESLLAADIAYAHHHWQFWAEAFLARFAIPRVGNADTFTYYLEAKYKFTPQFFGAVRWNQQLYGTVPEGANRVRWGREVWRLDVAPAYRFTPHALMKLQYSLEHGRAPARDLAETVALQLVLRF